MYTLLQGRLQEQNKSLNKDDLLSMVRWGAEEMFSAKDAMITNDDIDKACLCAAALQLTIRRHVRAQHKHGTPACSWSTNNLRILVPSLEELHCMGDST